MNVATTTRQQHMNTYNRDNIGKLISWRGDHFVYEYGEDNVIKFSKFDFLLGFEKAQKIVPEEYTLCKQFFGEYILDSEIVVSDDQKRVALIQRKIVGHCLTRDDLRNEEIRRQFREIAERYSAMVKSGHSEIDLVGHEGVFRIFNRCLGNILVTNTGKLVIYDVTSLNMSRFALFIRPLMYCLAKIFLPFQRSTIHRFLAQAQ